MPEAEEKQEEAEQEDQDLWTLYSPLISGGWKCLSFNLFSKSHPPKLLAQPHGPTPLGRLYISPRGWLAVHIAAVPDRDVASDKKKDEEENHVNVNVNAGLAMYCGYLKLYRRREDDGQEELYWRTVVEVSSDSNLIGGVQERKVVFEEMERKKKSSDGGGSGGGGGQQEEEKSYYMILEPKQDWIMEVRNIASFSFCFFIPCRLLLAGVGWIGFLSSLSFPFFCFLVFHFIWGKRGMIFFSYTEPSNSQLSN